MGSIYPSIKCLFDLEVTTCLLNSDHLPYERMKGTHRKQIRWQNLGKSQFAECEILLNILSKGPILNFFEYTEEIAMVINCCNLIRV